MEARSSGPVEGALWRVAQALNRRSAEENPARRALPPLLFLTDPQRTPDPSAVAQRLPRGAGVIYRGFGAHEAPAVAARLKAIAVERGLVLLIGVNADLAATVGADGVHLPERMIDRAPELRNHHPDWLITCAVHDSEALRAAEAAGVDAAVLSTVFHSSSPSAGPALGVELFDAMVRASKVPVYGLGGIDDHTAERLTQSGAVGLAGVEGVMSMKAGEG
jgi:thiamine-phosphate pyrophosphorylase